MRTLVRHLAVLMIAPVAVAQSPGEVTIVHTRSYDVGGLEVELEIGRLYVPENREAEDSNVIELTFGRFRSPAAEPAAPMVFLAGGPGSSATRMADNPAGMVGFRPVLEVCDLILLDQRGVGRSKPNLRWSPDEPPATDVFLSEANAKRFVLERSRRAAEHFRSEGIDLAGYTTVQSADDLNDLRKGLGLEKISLYGFSYGTHLGLATIRRHGEHLENVVLVGTEGPHQTFKLPSNADTQLRRLAIWVREDPAVGPYVPDLVGLLQRVLDKLEREPMVVTIEDPDGNPVEVPVGKFGLQLLLRFDIGDRSDLVVFPKLLHTIDQGDPSVLKWFVAKRFGMLASISGMSWIMDGASGATPGRWDRIHAEAAGGLLGNTMNFPYPDINDAWDTPDLGDDFRSPIVSDVRTLFVSGTLDWNTPPYQAEMVRWGFTNGTHIIVEGAGHEQITPQPAIREAIVAFLRGESVGDTHVELPPLRFVPLDGWDPEVTHPSAALARHLRDIAARDSLDAALAVYGDLRDQVNGERELNAFGYELMWAGRVKDAIRVFTLNVEENPDSWNVYDSLAEAYATIGDKPQAIAMYKRSLQLNPDNANGERMLRELE